jgi:hypothetical protein
MAEHLWDRERFLLFIGTETSSLDTVYMIANAERGVTTFSLLDRKACR